MKRSLLLCLVFLICVNGRAADNKDDSKDVTARIFNLPADAGPEAVKAIQALFPEGADVVNVAEVGPDGVVTSTHAALPTAEALLKLVTDEKVGGHLAGETTHAQPADTSTAPTDKLSLPKTTWRLKLFICRVVANAAIAGGIILLKDYANGSEYEWGRAATNAAVHGTVNGFFQWFGFRVADFAYANWTKNKFFPNFDMKVSDLLFRTLFNSWPKRILCTIASVLIYRATDYAFHGVFDFDWKTVLGIAMNIAATLGPAALGLEMAARMGPKRAEGLPARNNQVFDIQNLSISVLFAAALAANSKEMNQAFGIHGVWLPVYSAVAIGGALWWVLNSRWSNPELLPTRTYGVSTVKAGVQACGNALGAAGRFFTGHGWRGR